jgi:transcription elongation factor GreB
MICDQLHSRNATARNGFTSFKRDSDLSRYRPPTRPGSQYITPEGAQRLREELDALWREERPRVTQAVSEAAAQGDRSENAEYTYGKRRLREIDSRVRFLRKRLEGMIVVDQHAAAGKRDPRRVYFGAWVEVEDDAGATRWYRIVGPDEFDMSPDYVSMDSPLGTALLRRQLDDEVTVAVPGPGDASLPGVSRRLIITAVHYGDHPAGNPRR